METQKLEQTKVLENSQVSIIYHQAQRVLGLYDKPIKDKNIESDSRDVGFFTHDVDGDGKLVKLGIKRYKDDGLMFFYDTQTEATKITLNQKNVLGVTSYVNNGDGIWEIDTVKKPKQKDPKLLLDQIGVFLTSVEVSKNVVNKFEFAKPEQNKAWPRRRLAINNLIHLVGRMIPH